MFLEKRKEKLSVLRDKLAQVIQENKDNVLVQLISNIKDIHNYVVKNNLEKCPVCSSTPERQLNSCIEHNISSYTAKLQKDTSYVEKAVSIRNKILKNLSKIEERISQTSSDLSIVEVQLARLIGEYDNYRTNELYSEELSQSAVINLKSELDEVKEKITLQQRITETIISLKKLQDELKDLGNTTLSSISRIRTKVEVESSIVRLNRASQRILLFLEKQEDELKKIYSEIQDDEIVENRLRAFIDLLTTNNMGLRLEN